MEIIYQDIAPLALENSTFSAINIQDFSNVNSLNKKDIEVKKFGTLEEDYYLLDGSFSNFPDNPKDYDWGYFGTELSTEDNVLVSSPVLTINLDNGYYTSTGITLIFDLYGNNYATDINVKWYKDSTLLLDKNFYPDSVEYFVNESVDFFNKIEITFNKMNRPNVFLKITKFLFGTLRTIGKNELINIDIDMSISPISEELNINTLNFALQNKKNINFNFQNRQAIKAIDNGEIIGTFYITSSKQKSQQQYEISCEDAIGQLEDSNFYGGMYDNITVENLISEIMKDTNIEYSLEDDLKNINISGYLPITTKREALKQISFAINAIISTAYSEKINIYTIKPNIKVIEKSKIFYGGSIETTLPATEVQILEHNFTEDISEIEIFKGTLSLGEHFIQFNEPIHDVTLSSGNIIKQDVNYCIINTIVEGEVSIKGKKYIHSTKLLKKINPNITAGTIPNIVKSDKYTLITKNNSTKILDIVYNKYINTNSLQQEIILENVRLGDKAITSVEFGKRKAGIINHLEINGRGATTGTIEMNVEYEVEEKDRLCGTFVCGEEFRL